MLKSALAPYNRWVMRIFFNLAAKGTTDPAATPHPVFSDVRVRQAVRMAIDVDTISKEFFLGYAVPTWTEFFRPPYNTCDIPRPVYDPEAAASFVGSKPAGLIRMEMVCANVMVVPPVLPKVIRWKWSSLLTASMANHWS